MPKTSYEGIYDTNGFPRSDVYVPNVGSVPLQGGTATSDGTTAKQLSAPGVFQLADAAGVNQAAVDAQGAQLVALGGKSYKNCASAASTSVKGSAGRCCKVIVLTTGTGTATLYDNTSGSGQIILSIPASAAAGTVYDIQVPCGTGIYAVSAASGPALLVTYN